MNLPMRQDKKRNQALDAFASVAKTWSEWRLGERAAKSVATGTKKASNAAAKARRRAAKSDSSGVRNAMKSTPVKIAGAAAVLGGVGAAIAKKLKGPGTAEPLQTPSAPTTSGDAGDLSGTASAVATSEQAIAAAGQRADDEPAEGASEKAAAASTAPPPSGTEPTIPDTDVAAAADTTGDDEVEDAMEVHSDSGPEGAQTGSAVSAEADAAELEPAPAGDGHDDDSPSVPADDARS